MGIMQDEPSHIGERLRARREALDMSVSDVSKITHIREDYITAIERLDPDSLPAIGYVLGFIRSYAKGLGLNADEAVADYKRDIALADGVATRGAPHFVFRRTIRLPRGFAPALTVIAIAAMIGTWYGVKTEAVAEQTAMPIVLPRADIETPTGPILEEGLLTLRTNAPSWIEISDAQGTRLVSRIFVRDETWQGPANEGYRISVRDAGAVELYDGARHIGPLGAKGEPLSDVLIGETYFVEAPQP